MTELSEREFPFHLTLEDLARLSGQPAEFVSETLANEDLSALTYRHLTPQEETDLQARIKDILADDTVTKAGGDTLPRWTDGWGEVLERVRQEGVSADTLRPQYFRHDLLRLEGHYIRASSVDFERRLFELFKILLFRRYLADIPHVAEIGCGTGANLYQLHKMFPEKRLTGCDWAPPSQELLKLIGSETGANIHPVNFNMRTLEGRDKIDVGPDTAIVTLHAMEQLGDDFEAFLGMILDSKPALCVHLEPIAELYEAGLKFDQDGLNYHNKRRYLSGYFNKLNKLYSAKKIEIVHAHRAKFGSTFQEAYTTIVWRPI